MWAFHPGVGIFEKVIHYTQVLEEFETKFLQKNGSSALIFGQGYALVLSEEHYNNLKQAEIFSTLFSCSPSSLFHTSV